MHSAGNAVARNSLFSVTGQIALKLLSFVFVILVVRQLGEHDYGRYAAALAFVGIFSVFADMGIASYAVREIARARDRAPSLLVNMALIRIGLSVLVIACTIGGAWLVGYDRSMIGLIAMAGIGLLLYAVLGAIEAVLKGFERYDTTSLGSVINQVVFIAAAVPLLWLGWGPEGVIGASYAGVVVTSIVMWRLLRRQTDVSAKIEPGTWLPLIGAGLPFALSTFAMLVSFKADVVLLSLWRTPSEVGWYSVAYSLIFTLLIPLSSFTSVLVPSLTRQHELDPARIPEFYLDAMRVVWMVALPIAAGTTLLADRFIVTLYGEAYARAGTALQILIWTLPLLSLTTLCGSISIVLQRERSVARLNTLNAVVNVSLNIWAIKQYGIVGAAVLTLLTELVGLGQFSLVLRDVIPVRSIGRIVFTPVLAVGLMSGVVYLASSLPLIPLVALGAGAYAVLLVATGAVTVSELRVLSRVARSRLVRRPATIV